MKNKNNVSDCDKELNNEKVEETLSKDCSCDDKCNCDEEIISLQKQIEDMKNINVELENSVLRTKADFVNNRKRLEEETIRNMKYCNEDIVKELLPVIDNFERAIKLDNSDLSDELSKFLSGFKMMYCSQIEVLEKFGVKAIDGNNKPFDPSYHQAIMTEKREGVEPGMILEVLQKGYLLKDKVIRHAMVKVSE